jgi:hypothetical protein
LNSGCAYLSESANQRSVYRFVLLSKKNFFKLQRAASNKAQDRKATETQDSPFRAQGSYLCKMNLEYRHLLPGNFSDKSRVWIYQSSRMFTLSEALEIEELLSKFTAEWQSHGAEVDAYGNLFFGQFLVLMADETRAGVSGCSTDSSVRFVKSLGEHFGVDFFNRTNLAFVVKEKVQVLPLGQLSYALQNGFVDGDTLYFNNLVQTKKEWEENWIIPVRNSWLARKLTSPAASER